MAEQKISGAEAMARIATLEAFVKVLIHREIALQPSVRDELLQTLAQASREQAKAVDDRVGHRQLSVHAEIHTDDFLEAIRNELGATS